jgi:hypothetical protein
VHEGLDRIERGMNLMSDNARNLLQRRKLFLLQPFSLCRQQYLGLLLAPIIKTCIAIVRLLLRVIQIADNRLYGDSDLGIYRVHPVEEMASASRYYFLACPLPRSRTFAR